jgi:hypothetical protein
MDDYEIAARALAMAPEELLAELGAELAGTGTAHLKDGELDDLKLRASNWLARNWRPLRERLCGNPAIEAVRGNEVLEMLAVADLIAEVWLHRPGAMTAAAIICKFGLVRLCAGDPPTGLK